MFKCYKTGTQILWSLYERICSRSFFKGIHKSWVHRTYKTHKIVFIYIIYQCMLASDVQVSHFLPAIVTCSEDFHTSTYALPELRSLCCSFTCTFSSTVATFLFSLIICWRNSSPRTCHYFLYDFHMLPNSKKEHNKHYKAL